MRDRGHDHKSYTLYHIKFYCSKATLRRLEKVAILAITLKTRKYENDLYQKLIIYQKIFSFKCFRKRLHIDSYQSFTHFFM